jgi:hypothetical protein
VFAVPALLQLGKKSSDLLGRSAEAIRKSILHLKSIWQPPSKVVLNNPIADDHVAEYNLLAFDATGTPDISMTRVSLIPPKLDRRYVAMLAPLPFPVPGIWAKTTLW